MLPVLCVIQVLYNELNEQYRRSMMTNAQLDDEKQALVYQVEDHKASDSPSLSPLN